MANTKQLIDRALNAGEGILQLKPTWVPRVFCIPGRRLKLHPDDLYAYGADRGGIDERWFCSTTHADNGPKTTPNEGLSEIVIPGDADSNPVLLRDAIDEMGAAIIGERLMNKYGKLPVYSKFFDNLGPLPFHLHQMEEAARSIGLEPKPEAYYFPVQLNNYGGRFPYTFFGFKSGTTRDEVRHCLETWNQGDNNITDLSRAYALRPGTGWDVPAGVLHAPGSLLTYEPQYASDVYAMFESLVDEQPISWDLLVKNVPTDHQQDLDYLLDMINWEDNLDPDFAAHRFMKPKPAGAYDEQQAAGYADMWITYKSPDFSAKETTILPGACVTLHDSAAYGVIFIQGHGQMGVHAVESPTLVRFEQITQDEFWVTEDAAKDGVQIINDSQTEPLVLLRHYGPENPDLCTNS